MSGVAAACMGRLPEIDLAHVPGPGDSGEP